MKRTILFLSLFTVTCLTACGPFASEKPASANERGQYLVDQEYYDEAIFSLNAQLEKNPADPRTRILLASSYAAKHGIVLTSFTSVARRLIRANAAPIPVDPQHPERARLEAAARVFQNTLQAFHDLPSLEKPEDDADVVQAMTLLEGPGLGPGARIMRALLGVVHVKYLFDHSDVLQKEKECALDTARYRVWIGDIDHALMAAIQDLQSAFADPQTKKELADAQKGIHKSLNEMLAMADEFDQAVAQDEDPPLLPQILEEALNRCAP